MKVHIKIKTSLKFIHIFEENLFLLLYDDKLVNKLLSKDLTLKIDIFLLTYKKLGRKPIFN